jgi:hypothetical protein
MGWGRGCVQFYVIILRKVNEQETIRKRKVNEGCIRYLWSIYRVCMEYVVCSNEIRTSDKILLTNACFGWFVGHEPRRRVRMEYVVIRYVQVTKYF